MNDEIKEILEYLKDKNDYIEDFGISYKRIHIDNGDLKLLLDYITNLQQERNMFKGSYETMSKNYFEEKSKNEKAIEYIKNNWYELNTLDIEHCINLGKDIRIDLLNILQNGSEEDEYKEN